MGTRCRRLVLAVGSALAAAASPGGAGAELSGVVFVDRDADGVRDPGEPGWGGAVVTNGHDVARTDAEGRYRLPAADGLVRLTRPAGYACERWYAAGAPDFALVPEPDAAEFFFVQLSDAHVFERIEDFEAFSQPPVPWFVPQLVVDLMTVRTLRRAYGGAFEGMRRALAPWRDAGELSDLATLRAWRRELARAGSPLGDVAGAARSAFREVASLGPAFVIHTGDLVLEGNRGSPEAVERWFRFYRELRAELGVPVYDTFGNNEIAGIQNEAFPPDHPGYGRRSFERHLGPTTYSFDRGDFHFVALDTHRPSPRPEAPEWWDFGRMREEVRAWADADLAAHRGTVGVVLNHEPFHYDPAWPFAQDPGQTADDEGLFSRHGVAYVLSGHTHWNSFQVREGVTHLTTGALSGLRWVLPAGVHERGYRLFYAREGRLHGAWKRTGEPVVALAEGGGDGEGPVLAAADGAGPFARVEVRRDGAALPVERWGSYFLRVPDGDGPLVVTATSGDGGRLVVELAP